MSLHQLTESVIAAGWAKEVQAEFNALLKRFGAVSPPHANKDSTSRATTLFINREIRVLPSQPDSLDLHRDKRARGLLLAIAKLLIRQVQAGREVDISYYGVPIWVARKTITTDTSLQEVLDTLLETTRLEPTIQIVSDAPDGDASPLILDLRLRITRPFGTV